ncbi:MULTISPECIES: hypothetical protein [Paenibacillus]|uniref:Uncharacterized protein n=1 Tax=Paenibacillus thiaminolyticus TaxID=49283 RepID=A0A3A3GN94_PANTH|nr:MULTISPECIES: hypothetical protein [Paenibacillus]NEZ45334.1 hypothetical protein [Paenibacillus alvei]RJG26694.1 hypothetical protein DQX05_01285 [Paenibacillus thiaminolyticus]
MPVIKQKEKKDEKGSTKAKGSYVLSQEGEDYSVNVNFYLRKSGVNGTGKGYMVYAIFDRDKQVVYSYNKGFTVGADAIAGTASKDDSEESEIMGWDGKGTTVFKVEVEKDSSGIPTSAKDITDFIGSAISLDDLGSGGLIEAAGWIIEGI